MSVTLANGGSPDRSGTDFYPTPVPVTHALLDFIKLPPHTKVWEPAAGEGHITNVLADRGYEVSSSDLHSYTFEDFLATDSLRGDWIITNPPFMSSEAFIRHALSMKPAGVAMLLKSQYWHASKRLKLFLENPPSFVLPLTWRPDFLFGRKSGAPTMDVLWTVWNGQSPTIYQPLAKPQLGAQ